MKKSSWDELAKLTEIIANELGKRFCTSCQSERSLEGGKWKVVNKERRRWVCSTCLSKPILFSKGVNHVGTRVFRSSNRERQEQLQAPVKV